MRENTVVISVCLNQDPNNDKYRVQSKGQTYWLGGDFTTCPRVKKLLKYPRVLACRLLSLLKVGTRRTTKLANS